MGHLALAVARRAGLGLSAFGGHATGALGARVEFGERDLLLKAVRRFFEVNLQIVAQIVAALRATAGSSATATTAKRLLQDVVEATTKARAAEELLENVTGIMKSAPLRAGTGPRACARREGGMAKAVIRGPFLRIAECLVGLAEFLEFLLGLLVARILVGMILEREFAVGLLDFLFRSF